MKLEVLRKMIHETKDYVVIVYILHFEDVFQYMFSWNNEIFQHYVEAKPKYWKRMVHFFNPKFPLFTKDEVEEFEGVMLSGAIDSIDALFVRGIKKEATVLEPVSPVPLNK